MPSVFRSEIVLPFLFYELLEELTGAEGLTPAIISEAYEETHGSAIAGKLQPIVERLVAEATELASKEPSNQGKAKQVFGTSLSNHLSQLSPEQLCFLVADHDPVKAKEFYCKVDKQIVMTAAKERVELLSELSNVWFEAVLFGMGGHYKGNGPKDNVYDLSNDSEAAKARLKKLRLM